MLSGDGRRFGMSHANGRGVHRAGARSLGAAFVLALAACGGGGGGSGGAVAPPPGGTTTGWVPGVFRPASDFVAQCANPRTGIDPQTSRPYADRPGSTLTENNWLRSWSHDLYLWYNEILDRDPASFATLAYFDVLKTTATTPSGRPKDNFHFYMPTPEWLALSQSGVSAGYGARWAILASRVPRDVRVAYTEPGSPAAGAVANLQRGTRVRFIDGVDLTNDQTTAGVATINAALFPSQTGATHTFTVQDPGGGALRDVTLTSLQITSVPVQNVTTIPTPSGVVGYLLFNDHIATAETALIDAVNLLNSVGVDDLVVDLRYNGGGFLAIASELAYMIAGPQRTEGRTFELLRFNDKHRVRNPVTGERLEPLPFANRTVGLSAPANQPLPSLNLNRVFLLTGAGTCSASETIINALRGIGFPVVIIGDTTCGKPYGFYPTDNCGTTYFTVQFNGVNEQGFGEYPDGFSPANSSALIGVPVTGCAVRDDFGRALGDPAEARLAAALAYRSSASCPTPPATATATATTNTLLRGVEATTELRIAEPEWLRNRILVP
jgi:carboxyl-terminal processing protease